MLGNTNISFQRIPYNGLVLLTQIEYDDSKFKALHCRFDADICTTEQAPLAPNEDQAVSSVLQIDRQPHRFPHSGRSSTAFNLRAMSLGEKAKAAWSLRALTLKPQAVITQRSGKAASGKLV